MDANYIPCGSETESSDDCIMENSDIDAPSTSHALEPQQNVDTTKLIDPGILN